MLILTRKCGERIRIGDEITVTVLRVEGGQVRIGVDAPRAIPVHREEIYCKIEDMKRAGARNVPVSSSSLLSSATS